VAVEHFCREKIIENFSEKLVIIADESKNVDLLGISSSS
jgi:ribose 5-phosphate isomerase